MNSTLILEQLPASVWFNQKAKKICFDFISYFGDDEDQFREYSLQITKEHNNQINLNYVDTDYFNEPIKLDKYTIIDGKGKNLEEAYIDFASDLKANDFQLVGEIPEIFKL